MKNSVVILIFIVWAGSVSAQTFNLTTKLDFINLQFYDVKQHKQSLYISAYGQDSLLPNNTKFLILKFDIKGNLKKSFSFYDDSIGVNFFSFENSLEISGNKIIARVHVDGNATGYRIYYIQLDTNLNLLKTNYQPITGFKSIYGYATIKTADKSIYTAGGLQKNNFDVDVFIQKLDSNLNQIWYKNIGTSSNYERGHSILELSNGNLLIGAHRTDPGMTVAGQRYKEQTWIFEIDTAGNLVREFLDTNTHTGPAKGLTQTVDGGYVYCGKYQTGFDGHLGYNYGGSIGKIDGNLQFKKWEKVVTDTSSNIIQLENLKMINQTTFVAVGNNIGFTENNNFNRIISGYLISFTDNGLVNFSRYYTGKDSIDQYYDNYLYSITVDNNNSIIAVGQVDPSQTPTEGWIIKLDSLGCLAPTNCGNPGLLIQESKELFYEFDIYPNPVKETLFINTQENIEHLKIYNTLGEKVVEQRFPPNQVNLSALISGLYFMNLKTAKGVFTKKFVKE